MIKEYTYNNMEYNDLQYDTETVALSSYSLPSELPDDLSKDLPETLGYGIMLYSDKSKYSSSEYRNYEQLISGWKNHGLDMNIVNGVTVFDLKNSLAGKSVIILVTHGYYESKFDFSTLSTKHTPIIATSEMVTREKKKEYSLDLKNGSMKGLNTTLGHIFCIYPKFFENNYKNDELENSVVYMTACNSFGEGTIDYAFAEAITNAGASVVVGYLNSVDIFYARAVMDRFILDMLLGKTSKDAFDNTIFVTAESDKAWYEKLNNTYSNNMVAAYPLLYGDKSYLLWNAGVKNGSFEKYLTGWGKEGDVRVLPRLGEIAPPNGHYMAVITTGVGSAESKYLNGTEGSLIMQRVRIPNNATKLTFLYNMVSEEPMEYVGSRYDDKFFVRVCDVHGKEVSEMVSESINKSSWHNVSGVDFDGGDHTVYQTGWRKASIDVSSFSGCYITLKFNVIDVGDSAYDTAALIDNVKFE